MAKVQDDAPPPEADSAPEDDTAPQDHADDRPWYMPRITAQDLPPQDHPEDAHAPAPKPRENTTRSSRFDGAPPADRSTSRTRSSSFSPSPHDLRDDLHSPAPDSPAGKAPAQDNRPALPGGRLFEQRSAPESFLMQQMGKGPSGPPPQQRLQESQRSIAALQRQEREPNPPADGSKPAEQGQTARTYRRRTPDKLAEVRETPSRSTSEAGETPARRSRRSRRPGRSTDPGPQFSIEIDKVNKQMSEMLLARRAAYDKLKIGNMPLSTDELTQLMELDYQLGLIANSDSEGMTFDDLMNVADDKYFYHVEPNQMNHPGHEGFRGSGFALVENTYPQFDNPHIKRMARVYDDPYFGWEINYNVVGQWLRIAGYSRLEAMQFLAAWLGTSPTKWGSLDLDRQTWFWIGYDYADARQKGWHPAKPTPSPTPPAKPGNY